MSEKLTKLQSTMEMIFEEGSKINCELKSVSANMDGRKKDIVKILTHSVEDKCWKQKS